ncbi:hypothetical protein E2562_025459, partial [Oryza meyeriana var. granulata]
MMKLKCYQVPPRRPTGGRLTAKQLGSVDLAVPALGQSRSDSGDSRERLIRREGLPAAVTHGFAYPLPRQGSTSAIFSFSAGSPNFQKEEEYLYPSCNRLEQRQCQ